jgi:hypothetical protein
MDAGDAPPSQLLSGETTILSASPTAAASPLGTQDVSFVVGPDGQMIAVQKEPFVWKQFFIGFGVPGIFMVLPFILLAISGATALDDERRNDEVTMTQTDGTNYSGVLTLGEDRVVDECRAYELHTRTAEYFCDSDDDSRSRRIMMWVDGVTEDEEVGFWDSETGVLTFDDGADYGASFNLTMSSVDADWESDSDTVAGDLAGVACMGIPLFGIGMAIFGFTTGRKATGIGALVALAAFPFVAIGLLVFSFAVMGP